MAVAVVIARPVQSVRDKPKSTTEEMEARVRAPRPSGRPLQAPLKHELKRSFSTK